MKYTDYKDKYFSVLGDSISTLEGYSIPEEAAYYDTTHKIVSGVFAPEDTWWGQVIKYLKGKLLQNNSISGSTVCWHPLYEIPSYACSDERTSSLDREGISPDVIMIHMGTNDWGRGIKILCDDNSVCDKEKSVFFSSAYEIMLDKLQKNYPSSEIWCLTLPISSCSSKESFAFPYSYGGRHISEYCDAIRDCAIKFGCRVIDLYSRSVEYDTVDGFHPNATGMKQIADAVIEELSKED